MTEDLKNKIITRAIHFIVTNTKDDSQRIGDTIIEELKQVKLFTIPVVSSNMSNEYGKIIRTTHPEANPCMSCRYKNNNACSDECTYCYMNLKLNEYYR